MARAQGSEQRAINGETISGAGGTMRGVSKNAVLKPADVRELQAK